MKRRSYFSRDPKPFRERSFARRAIDSDLGYNLDQHGSNLPKLENMDGFPRKTRFASSRFSGSPVGTSFRASRGTTALSEKS
jgi:hypothetical protein